MGITKYYKNQYTGNENGWHGPIITLGETSLSEQHLNELNSQFRNTGIKYEDKQYTDQCKETTINQADHGEPNLAVKDGKLKPTKTKAADKMNETKKEAKHEGQQPAKATADDAFQKSDGEIKHAEAPDNGNKAAAVQTTAGQ
jgi:hypothetical protein